MAPENRFTKFIIEDKHRIRFITYIIKEGKLIYGATIFKKGIINLTDKLKDYHFQTSEKRLIRCPIITNFEKIKDKMHENKKKIFLRLLCNYGVRGIRLNLSRNITTPSPNFYKECDIVDNVKIFKFGRNISINSLKNSKNRKLNFVSNSNKHDEIKKIKPLLMKFPKKYRYIDNNRDIFILCRFDNDNIKYGATIYQKKYSDERLDKIIVEKHYETALERLIKCPVNIPYSKILELNNTTDLISDDIRENFVDIIVNNGGKILVSGDRIN